MQFFEAFRVICVMKRTNLSFLLIFFMAVVGMGGCIEDGFTTSPSDQPVFSVDTLDMGVIFTDQPSTTHRFTVYNRASKGLSISRISLSGANAGLFRLNVDGFSGTEFGDVEIRAKDSIFVFVETTLPPNERNVPVEVTASLDFVTNGVTRSVTVAAQGRDVVRLRAHTVEADTRLTADKPYQIFDSLVVAPGVTLGIDPGAELYFHDGARMVVRGTLCARGDAGKEIAMAGDRTGFVAADISFDIMDRQWTGLFFTSTSRDNEMCYTHVCNTWQGVTVDGAADAADPVSLLLVNSRLRNSGNLVLEVHDADISAYGCEFAEAAAGVVLLDGGSHVLNHCTLSNNYLFAAISGPILSFANISSDPDTESERPFTRAAIDNCILYGIGPELSHSDLAGTDIMLRRCLLKSAGNDDDNFISCLWDADPVFRTVREDYYFDYRVKADSPAIGAADPSLTAPEAATDRYGLPRGPAPDLGAYVYSAEK